MKSFPKFIAIILICEIIIVLGVFGYIKLNDETIFFTLYGDHEITLYEGTPYKELGFIAKDSKGKIINNRVIIESNLNNKVTGNYKITYRIKTKIKTITLERFINVIIDPLKNVTFNLNGSEEMSIALNEEFNDPLFSCIDKDTNEDLSSNVTILNLPDNQKVGTYNVKYTLNVNNVEKVLTRKVNVLEKTHDFTIENEDSSSKDISVNFTSYIPNFFYLKTPDGTTYYERNIDFTITENGNYNVIVYDNENNYQEYPFVINNIDKEPPVIKSCIGIIDNNQTTFTIATDNDDISKFVINDLTFNQTTYTIEQILEKATLETYDQANNVSSFDCSIYYKEIKPTGNETIIKNTSTDTLKIWVENVERRGRTSYYVSHIWAKDPYQQFKMQVPNNFGKELNYAKTLLDTAISKNNWQNKLMIAVNASGFIKNGSYGDKYYQANKEWNLTGGSPLVIVNGNTLRDFATNKIPNDPYVVYGMKKDGNLAYYQYKGGNNLQSNIDISTKIKNDGVLNTFAFEPLLVVDGKRASTSTTKNIRQGFCQIDKNNFVFITDVYNSSRNGFSFAELANYMIILGCKTGFNLDGGGSTSLIYKDANKTSETITGNTRELADIIYFHE